MFYTNTDLFSQGFEGKRSKISIIGGNQSVIRVVLPLETPGRESGPGLFWLLELSLSLAWGCVILISLITWASLLPGSSLPLFPPYIRIPMIAMGAHLELSRIRSPRQDNQSYLQSLLFSTCKVKLWFFQYSCMDVRVGL